MEPVDSAQKKSTQIYNPLQSESDAMAHLRLCEDLLTEVLLDLRNTGSVSEEYKKKMQTMSNTRVTPGIKIQDLGAPQGR